MARATTRSALRKTARTAVRADSKLADQAGAHSRQPAVRALSWASDIGDQPQMRTLCALLIGGGMLMANARLLRSGIRMLAAHELTTIAKDVVKKRIDRTRPRSARTQRQATPRPGNGRSSEVRSFPSGHSAGVIAVARAFSREFPEYRAAALSAAAAVAAVQVPRRAHYASDVAAGLAIGIAAEAIIDFGWGAAGDAIADVGQRR